MDPPLPVSSPPDRGVVAALRKHDEATFVALVTRYHAVMIRVAARFVSDPAVAEEVVQETWIGLLRGIDGFEGRSSLKTWLFTILVNQARRRGAAERRSVPFSSLPSLPGVHTSAEAGGHAAIHAVEGSWTDELADRGLSVEDALLAQEFRLLVARAVGALPANQQVVMALRDLEGWTGEEVCQLLDITTTNQRVRLHRARRSVRRAIEA